MKKFYLTLAMLCILLAGVQAQNENRIPVSDSKTIEKFDDGVTLTRIHGDITKKVNDETIKHKLIIEPEGRWMQIVVSNGVDYFNYAYDISGRFEDEVPEGTYSIAVDGRYDGTSALLSYVIEVKDDVTLTPAMSEATNFIVCAYVDENGVPFSKKNVLDWQVNLAYSWNDFEYIYHYSFLLQEGDKYNDTLRARFNNFGDNVEVYCISTYIADNQNLYAIQQPVITKGIDGNVVNVNNPSSFVKHQEFYHCNGDQSKYFAFGNANHYPSGVDIGFPIKMMDFDQSMPLNVFMDNVTPENSKVRLSVYPIVYESHPVEEGKTEFCPTIMPFYMWIDENGSIKRESLDMFPYQSNQLKLASAPNYAPYTPAMYSNQDGDVMKFGFRTPLTYFQTHEWGMMDLGLITFFGDGSSNKACDEISSISVLYDGKLNFEGDVHKFNSLFADGSKPNVVEYDVLNDKVVVDGIVKKNETKIKFDLTKDDKDAPTMTILKIMQNNKETVEISDLSTARIEMAAGDFASNFDEFKMEYVGKPNVEVYYSTEGKDWTALNYVENDSMFHVNYGNFFTVDLSQLDKSAVKNWVNLKFVVTDESGNSQEQELGNVFIVTDTTSINDYELGLSHVVYPNPFSSNVRICVNEAINGKAIISVYNVLGEQVYSRSLNCNETTDFIIDGNQLNAGLYLYSICTEKGKMQGKIVKK